MPDIDSIAAVMVQLNRATQTSRDMEGFTTDELRELALHLEITARSKERIDNELARRNGVAAGWIPDSRTL